MAISNYSYETHTDLNTAQSVTVMNGMVIQPAKACVPGFPTGVSQNMKIRVTGTYVRPKTRVQMWSENWVWGLK